jgi:hypothetical protein
VFEFRYVLSSCAHSKAVYYFKDVERSGQGTMRSRCLGREKMLGFVRVEIRKSLLRLSKLEWARSSASSQVKEGELEFGKWKGTSELFLSAKNQMCSRCEA